MVNDIKATGLEVGLLINFIHAKLERKPTDRCRAGLFAKEQHQSLPSYGMSMSRSIDTGRTLRINSGSTAGVCCVSVVLMAGGA